MTKYKPIKLSNNALILFYVISLSLVSIASKNVLPFNEILLNSLSEQLSADRIQNFISTQKKWEWLTYIIFPLLLLFKWLLTSIAMYTGTIFFEFKATFKELFRIVLLSEIVFLVLALVKFLWFFIYKDHLTLEYVQFFQPLSLSNLFNVGELEPWFIYPVQSFNLFELSYWFSLAFLLSKKLDMPFWKSFDFVLSTYVIGFLIWLVFVSFFILNLS